jgi:hypothetical protein
MTFLLGITMNMMKKSLVSILLIVVSISAKAELVFNEEFNRLNSKTVGNGWLELNKNANDVRIINETLLLRDNKKGQIDAGVARKFEGFEVSDLTISFDWTPLLPSDRKDYFKVSWATEFSKKASDWTDLFTTSLGANDRESTTAIIGPDKTLALKQMTSFYLMFWIDLGPTTKNDEFKEGVRIDNIRLDNTAPTSPVPLPSAIWFFVSGLFGLLAQRKLKN